MTADEIERFMEDQGVYAESALLPDREYQHPALNWVKGAFAHSLGKFLFDLRVQWTPESFDCDDYARLSATLAQILHNHTRAKRSGTALAFGEFWYQRLDGSGHAVNCAIVYDGEFKLHFFEPQTGGIVELAKEEKALCLGYRF